MRNQSKAKTGSRKAPAGLPAWRHATCFMHKFCMICTIADNWQPMGFRYRLDLPVTYAETTRRCRGVRVGLGPAAPYANYALLSVSCSARPPLCMRKDFHIKSRTRLVLSLSILFGLCCIGFCVYTSQYHPSIYKYGVTINCNNGLLQ